MAKEDPGEKRSRCSESEHRVLEQQVGAVLSLFGELLSTGQMKPGKWYEEVDPRYPETKRLRCRVPPQTDE